MSEISFLKRVNERAIGLLQAQAFIPSRLLEVRNGEACMCTGAAMLFAAHLIQGGKDDVIEFFADLTSDTEEDFVKARAKRSGLDPDIVREVIINSKAAAEPDRQALVPSILEAAGCGRAQ
jgi:hypothetical protein